MKLYLYNIKNNKHFATIYGKSKEECEARAEFSFGNDVPYGWTYAPDFDEINGLIFIQMLLKSINHCKNATQHATG